MRAVVLSIIASAVLASTPGVAAAAPKPPSCRQPGQRIVAANPHVQLYSKTTKQHEVHYYACRVDFSTGFDVGYFDPPPASDPVSLVLESGAVNVRLAGWYVAVDTILPCGDVGCRGIDAVVNMRTLKVRGTQLLNPPVSTTSSAGPATSFVVTPAGSVAWIRRSVTPPYTTYVVTVWPAGGQPRQLDSGPASGPGALAAKSLAVGGHTLYWTTAGTPHSAPIP